MRFLFDCEDEMCLPAAYRLVDEVKPFIDKMKAVEVSEGEANGSRKVVFKKIIENMMVKYPADTGKMFAKLWILDDGEKAPNTFKTMAELIRLFTYQGQTGDANSSGSASENIEE